MPLDLHAGSFKLDSSLDIPADGWSASLQASTAFRNAIDADRVTLHAGFYDDSGLPVFIAKVVDAIVDEFVLSMNGGELTVSISGRDKMALLLDKDVRRRYLKVYDPQAASGGIAFPNYFTVTVGTYYAAQIATQVATDVGLSVSWGLPNYKLNKDFEANGSAYEAIRSLSEPFNHLEPFKVDIYVEGNTLLVKQRQGFSMVAEYTYAVTDARILTLTITRRVLPRFHRVTVSRGQAAASQQAAQDRNVTRSETYDHGALVSAEEVETISQLGLHVSTTTTTFDPDGVTERKVARKYYRDGVAAQLMSIEGETTTARGDVTDDRPALLSARMTNPLEIAEETTIEERNEDGDLIVTKRITTSHLYDSSLFRISTTSAISEFIDTDDDGEPDQFVTTSTNTQSHLQVTPSMAQTVTTEFARDSENGQLTLVHQQTSQSGGFRPGGHAAPQPSVIDGFPYTRDEIISNDPRAHDVSFSNDDLDKAAIDTIFSQYKQASGAIEYELSFTAVGMPWLKKGAIIQLTGLFFEDGIEYTLLPALILSESLTYDESRERAELKTEFRAVFWRPGNPI